MPWATGAAVILLLALVALRLFRFHEPPACVRADVIAALVPVGLLSLGVWLTGLGRRPWTGLLLTAIAMVFLQGAVTVRQQQDRHFTLEYLRELRAIVHELQTDTVRSRVEDTARFGPFAMAVVRFSQGTAKMMKHVDSVVRDVAERPILSLEAFRSLESLAEAERRLTTLRNATSDFDDEITELMLTAMDDPGVPESVRDGAASGIEGARSSAVLSITAAFYDTLEELIGFMRARQEQYRYENGALLFRSPAVRQAYDALVQRVENERGAAAAEIERLKLASRAKAERVFDQLEERVR